MSLSKFIGLCFLIFTNSAWAQVPILEDISNEDLGVVVKEFAANFVHTSATPPTSLGKVFGVEASMIVGVTESPGVEALSKEIDPESDVPYIPHAWLLGGVSVPFGVSVEVNILPEVEIEDLKMNHTSVGLKWSITDQFFSSLPFDWAIRTYYTKSEISYRQVVSNTNFPTTSNVDVSFENTMIGGDSLIGFDFSIVQPYVGFGYVETDGELSGRASTDTPYSLFDDQISESRNSKQGSTRLIAGCQFDLPVINIGVEYTRVFDVNRYSAKVGVQF